eukprot:GHVN01012359.1.p1 GENE.GHVN01012359.1~~GHVN01012359.1.p1  ORF type:complete len:715 (-),score=189.12 GHVN01012359.1:1156-3135(-)
MQRLYGRLQPQYGQPQPQYGHYDPVGYGAYYYDEAANNQAPYFQVAPPVYRQHHIRTMTPAYNDWPLRRMYGKLPISPFASLSPYRRVENAMVDGGMFSEGVRDGQFTEVMKGMSQLSESVREGVFGQVEDVVTGDDRTSEGLVSDDAIEPLPSSSSVRELHGKAQQQKLRQQQLQAHAKMQQGEATRASLKHLTTVVKINRLEEAIRNANLSIQQMHRQVMMIGQRAQQLNLQKSEMKKMKKQALADAERMEKTISKQPSDNLPQRQIQEIKDRMKQMGEGIRMIEQQVQVMEAQHQQLQAHIQTKMAQLHHFTALYIEFTNKLAEEVAEAEREAKEQLTTTTAPPTPANPQLPQLQLMAERQGSLTPELMNMFQSLQTGTTDTNKGGSSSQLRTPPQPPGGSPAHQGAQLETRGYQPFVAQPNQYPQTRNPHQVIQTLSTLPHDQGVQMLNGLPPLLLGEVMVLINPYHLSQYMGDLPSWKVSQAISMLLPHSGAKILSSLQFHEASQVVKGLPHTHAQAVLSLLPPDQGLRLMSLLNSVSSPHSPYRQQSGHVSSYSPTLPHTPHLAQSAHSLNQRYSPHSPNLNQSPQSPQQTQDYQTQNALQAILSRFDNSGGLNQPSPLSPHSRQLPHSTNSLTTTYTATTNTHMRSPPQSPN